MFNIVLKNKWPQLSFELGWFNLFALGVLLPIFWVQYLAMFCWRICCCRPSMELFYYDNVLRLFALGVGVLVLSLFEGISLRLMLKNAQRFAWRTYLVWMFLRSLPVLTLLLALIALPEFQGIYGLGALIAGSILLGPVALKAGWAPVFSLPDQDNPLPRHHLKGLMIYLCLVAFLIPIYFSASAWACDCGSVSSVKANMHTLQTVVETYAIDHQGRYPKNLLELKNEGLQSGREYWKEFTNPFTGQSGAGRSYYDMPTEPTRLLPGPFDDKPQQPYRDILGIRIYLVIFGFMPEYTGTVVYDSDNPERYFIYGTGLNGKFIMDKGAVLTLTNG